MQLAARACVLTAVCAYRPTCACIEAQQRGLFTHILSSHTCCLHTHTVFTHIHPHPLLTPTPAPTYIHIHTRTPYLHMHTTTGTYRQAQPPRWLMRQAEDRDSYSLCLSLQTPRAMHTDTYRQLDGMHTGSYRQLYGRPPRQELAHKSLCSQTRACAHVLMSLQTRACAHVLMHHQLLLIQFTPQLRNLN